MRKLMGSSTFALAPNKTAGLGITPFGWAAQVQIVLARFISASGKNGSGWRTLDMTRRYARNDQARRMIRQKVRFTQRPRPGRAGSIPTP